MKVTYLTKSEEAQKICDAQWRGKIIWEEGLCKRCLLYCKCSNPPTVSGIDAYTVWMTGINEEAQRLKVASGK